MSFCPDSWPLVACSENPEESPGDEFACTALSGLSETLAETIVTAAKEFLWEATGQRFGLCPVTYRPCLADCNRGSTYMGWSGIPRAYGMGNGWEPFIWNGNWFNMVCGGCEGQCDASHMSTIQLPGPVNEVLEVVLDGAVFTDWTFDNLGLHRTDGLKWPASQFQALPLTDVGTFGVTVLQGLPVPAGGQLAAAALACQMAKAACSDGTCQLPRMIQTVVREGVTIAFQNSFATLYSQNSTGLWIVDSWVASVNRSARRRSRVLTPDARPTRRV